MKQSMFGHPLIFFPRDPQLLYGTVDITLSSKIAAINILRPCEAKSLNSASVSRY